MSHKVVKAARRAVRAIGHDPRDVQVATGAPIAKNFNVFSFSYGRRTLVRTCGRAIYRSLKKGCYVPQLQNDSPERLAA